MPERGRERGRGILYNLLNNSVLAIRFVFAETHITFHSWRHSPPRRKKKRGRSALPKINMFAKVGPCFTWCLPRIFPRVIHVHQVLEFPQFAWKLTPDREFCAKTVRICLCYLMGSINVNEIRDAFDWKQRQPSRIAESIRGIAN